MRRAWWVWSAVAVVVVADGATSARAADSARIVEVAQASAPTGAGMAALDALPWAERLGLEQAMAAADARYAPRMDETGPRLDVPGARFSASGAHLELSGHVLTLRAARMGRGELRSLPTASPRIVGPEVQTDRGVGVVEWWRSLPSGLEHGVTIAERPTGAGELVIEVAVEGLTARALSHDAVEFVDASGSRVATYAHLLVLDADGAHVPARMGVRDGRIAIAVNDEGARYPLVVDPVLAVAEEATLLASGAEATDFLGLSVALSADGSRALVGAPYDDTPGGVAAGTARVFLRTDTTWAEEATLLALDGAAYDYFGGSVALSADGRLALVGAREDSDAVDDGAGSARVFLRTGTTWAEEATLRSDVAGGAFGSSVALSADGRRALVGAPSDDTATGRACVFLRTGTTWAAEATLLASGGAEYDNFGNSVALSADGSRALVGAPGDDTARGANTGSTRVFLRTGTTWTEEATLLASDGANDGLGHSVALSADGSRALLGAPYDDTPSGANAGSARVFLRTGTTWAEAGTLLASDGAEEDRFGSSVALASDGSRALVGAPGDDTARGVNAGSTRVFLRTGTTWTEESTLRHADGETFDEFGLTVALSADGSRALVGAGRDDTAAGADAGSAHVFTIVPASPNGAACSSGGTCLSEFCVDGVCCESECGDGDATDCQACSAALTGGTSGVCAPLSATVAPTVTCRASTSVCDLVEVCSAANAACPLDAFAPATTECRAAMLGGACDAADTCSGTSAACVDAPAALNTPCRGSTGACDAAEACDGASFACPADLRIPAGVACGGVAGTTCSTPGTCDGVGATCPGASVLAAGTVCQAAAAGSPCDVDDICDGVSDVCQPTFRAAGTECAASSGGVCDAPDQCTGASGECLPRFLADVECRASAGGCDLAELCTGDVATCPPDQVSPSGTVCRASTELSCDPLESCDGTATACPADIITCERSDAGPADGGAADGGAPVAAAGCACGAAASGPSLGSILGLGLLALVLGARGRR